MWYTTALLHSSMPLLSQNAVLPGGRSPKCQASGICSGHIADPSNDSRCHTLPHMRTDCSLVPRVQLCEMNLGKDALPDRSIAQTVLRSAITLTMLPGPTISTNYHSCQLPTITLALCITYLLMPTKQHTHSTLRTTKTPSTGLTEPSRLRRDIPITSRWSSIRPRRSTIRGWRSLCHAFV